MHIQMGYLCTYVYHLRLNGMVTEIGSKKILQSRNCFSSPSLVLTVSGSSKFISHYYNNNIVIIYSAQAMLRGRCLRDLLLMSLEELQSTFPTLSTRSLEVIWST